MPRRRSRSAAIPSPRAAVHSVSAMTKPRMRHLTEAVGVDRRTVARWQVWWRDSFTASPFWQIARAAFMPPVDQDRLWSEQAVGIVGGEPKCCKSFLALDLAVAAGIPCLRRFAVPRAGRVLLYAAEDALHIVRRRLEGICATTGLSLADLDIQVITAPSVRLDLDADRRSFFRRPSPDCSRACSSSIRSCACIARRERQWRGGAAAGLSARVAATPCRCRARRPPRQEGRRPPSCRAGAARLFRFHAWGDFNLICAATATISPCRWSTAPPRPRRP